MRTGNSRCKDEIQGSFVRSFERSKSRSLRDDKQKDRQQQGLRHLLDSAGMDQKKRREANLSSLPEHCLREGSLEEDAELDRDVAGLRTVLRECVEVGRGATDIERPWAVVDEDVTNLPVEPLRGKARELIGHADSGIETRSITRVL